MPNLVRFTGNNRSYDPKISITRSGLISFNRACVELFSMKQFCYCILYYDKVMDRIGIEFTNDMTQKGIIKIRLRESGCDISARLFLSFIEYDFRNKETKKYQVKHYDNDVPIIIDLLRKADNR